MNSWIPYGRQTIEEDDIQAVVDVLRSDWLTTGPMVEKFERALAERVGAQYAVVFSSGTAALHAAYFAAGVGPGDEVITSPITFIATANAAFYLGAQPVFADVEPDTVNIDPAEVKRLLSERTKVIAPVDFAGHPADLDEIMDIAHSVGAVVVEDACHALGARYRARPVGSIADMTVFSFHPVKHITTGEGGAVTTNNDQYYERLMVFRNHGIERSRTKLIEPNEGPWYYEMQALGYNYRLSDIQCALGIAQLEKLDRYLSRRSELTRYYDEALADAPLIRPVQRPYVEAAWHLYVVRLSDPNKRRAVVEHLHACGIGVQVHYIPVYWHPYYQDRGYRRGLCPNAEDYYGRSITLPLYPRLGIDGAREVVSRTLEALA